MTELQGNILVTGVSRGLGLAVSEKILSRGGRVVGLSRRSSDSLRRLQKRYKDRMDWIECDLSNSQSVERTLSDSLGKDLAIHGLVNNAALAYDDLATNLNSVRLEEMFQVNVFAAMQLTKYCIRRMLLYRVPGSLVHVSSVSTQTGYKGLSMYAASKAAMEGFSKGIAREWGSLGIRSNCVVPGFMETEMSADLSEEQRQKIYRRTSLKKATEIDSVVSAIVFLLHSDSASMTGQNVVVDSGPFEMRDKLVVLGDRTANEALESAQLSYASQFQSIDKLYYVPSEFPQSAAAIEADCEKIWFHAGVAKVSLKLEMIRACEARGWTAFSIVHPSAVIASSAHIGVGVYIAPMAVVSSNATVADHCIVHIHSSVGHDATVAPFCAILPGARLSGNVQIGARSTIGSNAFLAAGVTVGDDCQVDALAYLGQDLPEKHIASPRSRVPLKRVDI